MGRDKIGSFKERGDMEMWLNKWIKNYVTENPAATEEQTASIQEIASNAQSMADSAKHLQGLIARFRV